MSVNRTVNVPAPFYGIRPGFNIGDLDKANVLPELVLDSITATSTSSLITNGANSIRVSVAFTSPATTCDVVVSGALGNALYTKTGLNVDSAYFYMGGFEGVLLDGALYTITVQNIQNAAPLSVYVSKTS